MSKEKAGYLIADSILLIVITVVIGWIVMDTYPLKHTTYRVTQVTVLKPAQTSDTKITHVQKTDTTTDSMVIVPMHHYWVTTFHIPKTNEEELITLHLLLKRKK